MFTAATLLTIGTVTLTVSQWLAAAGVAGNVLSFGTELIKIVGKQPAGIHCRCAQPPNVKAANVPWFVHPAVPFSGFPATYRDWVPSGDGFRAATIPPPSTIKDHHHGRQKASIHS